MVRVALALILFFQTLTAYAGPPFITDDPSPVDYKHINVFLYTNYVNSPANRDLFLPGIEVDYGLAPRLEIDLLLSYDWHRNYTEPHRSTSGVGDSQISLKYEIWHETPTFPQVAFAPGYFFQQAASKSASAMAEVGYCCPFGYKKQQAPGLATAVAAGHSIAIQVITIFALAAWCCKKPLMILGH